METAESPLDVLSRAATMVQDSSPPDYDDERNSSSKELPTTRWRRERRCRERLGDYNKTKNNHDSTYDTPSTPPLPDVLGSRTAGDAPLDMTTSRGNKPPPSYSQSIAAFRNTPARPSVITCAPTSWTKNKNVNKEENGKQGHRRELLSGMCDPVIDEHFRRSLGKDYMNLFSSDCGSNNNSSSSNGNSSVTMTGLSVDDHFAKALGETWVKLQGQTKGSPSSSSSTTKLTAKEKKSTSASTATMSLSVAKESAPNTTSTTNSTPSLLQQRRGLVSI